MNKIILQGWYKTQNLIFWWMIMITVWMSFGQGIISYEFLEAYIWQEIYSLDEKDLKMLYKRKKN
jgi:hypothetical protein